ncbi:MAG TPA: DUF4395 domain-containing protein [Bacteroidota bacterium]|nr:DUF4395 domain-containing protein [Bacteroidota bacterium]
MRNVFQFGEHVEGYTIPVVNEREVRAAAGMLFLAMFTSLMMVFLKGDFLFIKYVISMFFTDFIIRVLINPRFSPTLILGRLIVGNQVPEYVGAAQKKFAWTIGLVLSTIVFVLLVIVNGYSPITGIICLTCLVFLFFESVFGICLGCKFYPMFHKEKPQYCPGEVCDMKAKQGIQKTSMGQLLVVLGFVLYILLTIVFFNGYLSSRPYDMFGISGTTQSR